MIDLKKKWAYAHSPTLQVSVARRGVKGSRFVFRSSRDDFSETHTSDGKALVSGSSGFDLVPLQTAKVAPRPVSAPSDPVNRPKHYTSHPSGVECIDVVRHMGFNLGNVVKYLWRAGIKDQTAELQDLKKAAWYLADEIAKRRRETAKRRRKRETRKREAGHS